MHNSDQINVVEEYFVATIFFGSSFSKSKNKKPTFNKGAANVFVAEC